MELGIVQGAGLTLPLTVEGQRQAAVLAKALADKQPDRIFASTARRAMQTAEYICAIHPTVPYVELAVFNERSKGEAEGLRHEEFAQRYPEIILAWARGEDPRPAGGESIMDVFRRVIPILGEHKNTYPDQTLMYIIHGNVIKVLLAHILDQDPIVLQNRLTQDYCAVNIVEYDSEKQSWRVHCINQTFN